MSMVADLPPAIQERVECSIIAAVKYEVPANIVIAVAEIEAGRPGLWVKNTNGTFDVGPMQFNTSYLADLARYGITAEDVAAPGCYPYDLAAWRLRGHILHDKGDIWTRAANYHSRTPTYNETYRLKLVERAGKWGTWLSARFTVTLEGPDAGAGGMFVRLPTAPAPAAAALPAEGTERQQSRPADNTYTPRRITLSGAH